MPVTWSDIISRGSGSVDYRLRIEGVEPEFCTPGMETGAALEDHVRWHGLRREGIGFSESVYLAGAEQNIQISPVQVDDGAGAQRGIATGLFSRIARVLDQLQVTCLASDLTMTVRDTTLADARYVYMGTETIRTDATSSTDFDIYRGQLGSTAQTHYVALGGPRPSATPIYDHPPGFVGRRVWLYAHGIGEAGVTDAGTVVWRGLIAKEPSEVSGVWTIQIEPRTKLLDGSVAGGFDEGLKLRGIYYPGRAPLAVVVRRLASTSIDSAEVARVFFSVYGFFETQREFLEELETTLNADATIVSWGISFEAREVDDGTWDLYMRTATSDPRYISVLGGSSVDGLFSGRLFVEAGLAASRITGSAGSSGTLEAWYDRTVSSDTMYRCERAIVGDGDAYFGMTGGDLRRVPRHADPSVVAWGAGVETDDAAAAAFPLGRLNLANANGLTTDDSIILTPLSVTEVAPQVLGISGVAGQTVFAYEGFDTSRWPHAFSSGGAQPEIVGAARYAGGDGSLADFRDDLLARAPNAANAGTGPWVTSDDIASWTTAVAEAAAGRSWLTRRNYTFAKSQRAIEVLREEWKLYGLIPYLDADARIAVRPLTFETRAPDYEIDATARVIDDGFGSVSGDDDGLVTVVHFFTGYDPIEDKHSGDDFRVRHQGAVARVHAELALEVKPKSRAVGAEMGYADAYARGLTITEIFGARRTQTVEFDVSLVMFPVLIGDAVLITIPQLPGDGDRGVWTPGSGLTGRSGYLVSRSWDLDRGVGTFRVLLHELAIAGYTPSAKVDSAAGSVTTWVLTIDEGHYSGTASDVQFFSVGDGVVLRQWDAASPVVRPGFVLSVDIGAGTIEVELDDVWTGTGGSRYLLTWDDSTDGSTSVEQLRSAYIAGPTGRIDAATDEPADRFAP